MSFILYYFSLILLSLRLSIILFALPSKLIFGEYISRFVIKSSGLRNLLDLISVHEEAKVNSIAEHVLRPQEKLSIAAICHAVYEMMETRVAMRALCEITRSITSREYIASFSYPARN